MGPLVSWTHTIPISLGIPVGVPGKGAQNSHCWTKKGAPVLLIGSIYDIFTNILLMFHAVICQLHKILWALETSILGVASTICFKQHLLVGGFKFQSI